MKPLFSPPTQPTPVQPQPVLAHVAPPVPQIQTHTEAMALNIVALNAKVATLEAQMTAIWRALGGPIRVG